MEGQIEVLERSITRSALAVCRASAGSSVGLTLVEKILPDDWGRNRVWRYRVQRAPVGFPDTIIVKTSKIGGGHVFDEWASLEFLNQFDALDGLIPRFYGGDEALELLVLEDLGSVRDHHDLGTILEGADAHLAAEALRAHALAMARLHITTAGHEATWDALRNRYPRSGRPLSKDQFAENVAWFLRTLPAFGLSATAALEAEARSIVARLMHPQGPRAYTRGDVCPSNVAYIDRQTRFYDFEMGAYRHILLSATFFRLSHLSCFNGNLIPRELQAEAEAIYFDALPPDLVRPTFIHEDYAAAATIVLIWLLSRYLEKRDRFRHMATLRQRVFAALTQYSLHPDFTAPYPHIAEALAGLQRVLDARWSDTEKTILLFPAFRSA